MLRKTLLPFYRLVSSFGIEPRQLLLGVTGLPKFFSDCFAYKLRDPPPNFTLSVRRFYPILNNFRVDAGAASGHYFHQDLWAAKKIFARRPQKHLDVGSRIDGFIAHLLVFMEVDVIDIRPLQTTVGGLRFIQDDATPLSRYSDHSVDSLSSLHAAEHFGLGRYSDPIDPRGHLKFMDSLQRVVAYGGRLYFSVPIGLERLEFNAHRIFSVDTVLAQFDALRLLSFSYVDDAGRLHENVLKTDVPRGTECGCGLFEFTK
jgi:hypothetical protein